MVKKLADASKKVRFSAVGLPNVALYAGFPRGLLDKIP
jgi:hypothetical protein